MPFTVEGEKKKDDEAVEEKPDAAAPLRADVLGSIAGANPASPGYLGKIDSMITAHGALDKMNPFSGKGSGIDQAVADQPTGKMPQMEAPSALMTPPPAAPTMGQPQPHRSLLGKIGHVFSRMGNIAGDIFAPEVMAITPGTDLNKAIAERRKETRADTQRELGIRETTANAEKLKAETGAKLEPSEEEKNTAEAFKDRLTPEAKTDFEAWQRQNPGKPVEEWLKLLAANKPGTQEQNKLDFQKVVGKLDAAGLPTGPKQIDASLDTALKSGVIGKDEHSLARSYQAANPTPATNLQVTVAGAQQKQGFEHTEAQEKETYKRYETAQDAEQRLSRMEASYKKALQGDQQAMLALLTDHIGMTLGLQKGARITKDILHEAAQSMPWLEKIESKFDDRGYLSGVTLGPEQMSQMLDLGYEARDRAVQGAQDSSELYGVTAPPGAEKVFGKRKIGDKPALQNVGKEPPRPANVPKDYIYKENGPKGTGWYKP